MEIKKLTFESWTEYDDWLMENYKPNAIFKVDEVDGKINIEYCTKEEFAEMKKK